MTHTTAAMIYLFFASAMATGLAMSLLDNHDNRAAIMRTKLFKVFLMVTLFLLGMAASALFRS